MLLIFKEFTDSLGSEIKRKIEVCFLGAVIIKFETTDESACILDRVWVWELQGRLLWADPEA